MITAVLFATGPLLHAVMQKPAPELHKKAPLAVTRPNARPIPVSPVVLVKKGNRKGARPSVVIEPLRPDMLVFAHADEAKAGDQPLSLKGKISSRRVNTSLADEEPFLKSEEVFCEVGNEPAPGSDTEGKNSSIESRRCSLDVANMGVSKVFQSISQQTGVNFVLLASTDQKVTVQLKATPLIDILRHVCAITSLSYLKMGGTYVIASDAQLKTAYPKEWAEANPDKVEKPPVVVQPVPVIAEIYTCSYVNANQIVNALSKTFEAEKLSVQVGPGQQVPTLNQQDSNSATGTSTTMMTKTEGGDSGGNPNSRTVVIRGPKDVVEAAIALAKKLDIARPQVSVGVKINDISNDALKELGLSWGFSDQKITESKGSGINFGTFTRSALGFTAQIAALETANKAKILAEPRVSVLDNEKAFILIGQRVNFPTLIGYTQNNTPIFDRKEERVGIYLQVSASIAENGDITLTLYPQVSTITGFININGGSYPQIATREAQTTLRVRSGDTIVLGGLIRDEDLKQIERVPILSDIPFFGELFKRRKSTHISSQVIITITPVVVPPTGSAVTPPTTPDKK